jgi:hypothetical protein
MDFRTGQRVFLQLADGGTVLAAIEETLEHAAEQVIRVEVLEDPLTTRGATQSAVVGILLVDDMGLSTFPAHGLIASIGSSSSLSVGGPGRVLQRRHHERYPIDLPATVRRLQGGAPSHRHEGHVVDISVGGLRLVGGPTDVGDTVLIDLRIAEQPIELVGRVLLAYPDGHGARVAHVAFLVAAGSSGPSDRLEDYIAGRAAETPFSAGS